LPFVFSLCVARADASAALLGGCTEHPRTH
jgi:hypothetical protein